MSSDSPARRAPLERLRAAVAQAPDIPSYGTVSRMVGLTIEGRGPLCTVGEACRIHPVGGGPPVPAEVVGFHERAVLLMPLGDVTGLGPGSRIESLGRPLSVPVGEAVLGRVLDGLG
ncbi:MAG TPA: hypothetical protein VIK93_00925, partial [Limnochordales bacterium]